MNIPVLGELRPHPKIHQMAQCRGRWLFQVGFNGQKLTFILNGLEESDEEVATTAVMAFLGLGIKEKLAASEYVFANYSKMAELVDEEDLGCQISSKEDVWTHVHPSEIFVSKRRRREQAIYIQVTAECDWEPEHGLQIIYRRGNELSRVSDQDGHVDSHRRL